MEYLVYLALSGGVLLFDQLTKYWAVTNLNWQKPIVVWPVLNWALTYNRGAAFSILNNRHDWTKIFFVSFGALMSIVLLVWIAIEKSKKNRLECVSLSFILGGAVGNLFDRLHYGYVIDFIQLHIGSYYWPVFNVADSFICIGALMMLTLTLIEYKKSAR